jgi:prepilin-type processing-associated H-X9-DG protein
MRCPSDYYFDPLALRRQGSYFERYGSSYFYFRHMGEHSMPLSSFPNPAGNLLLHDEFYFHGGDGPATGMANMLFVDLHVKLTPWMDLEQVVYDPYSELGTYSAARPICK